MSSGNQPGGPTPLGPPTRLPVNLQQNEERTVATVLESTAQSSEQGQSFVQSIQQAIRTAIADLQAGMSASGEASAQADAQTSLTEAQQALSQAQAGLAALQPVSGWVTEAEQVSANAAAGSFLADEVANLSTIDSKVASAAVQQQAEQQLQHAQAAGATAKSLVTAIGYGLLYANLESLAATAQALITAAQATLTKEQVAAQATFDQLLQEISAGTSSSWEWWGCEIHFNEAATKAIVQALDQISGGAPTQGKLITESVSLLAAVITQSVGGLITAGFAELITELGLALPTVDRGNGVTLNASWLGIADPWGFNLAAAILSAQAEGQDWSGTVAAAFWLSAN